MAVWPEARTPTCSEPCERQSAVCQEWTQTVHIPRESSCHSKGLFTEKQIKTWKGQRVCRLIFLDLDWHIFMQVNYVLKKTHYFYQLWFVLICTSQSLCVCVRVIRLLLMIPLTWPGAPRSSCSGTAGCRKETGSLPISSWPPSLPCSPPACLQSKQGQNTSPCGSNCGRQERQTKTPWVVNDAARWPFLSFYSLCLFTSTLSLLPGKKTQACILSSFLYFCFQGRT